MYLIFFYLYFALPFGQVYVVFLFLFVSLSLSHRLQRCYHVFSFSSPLFLSPSFPFNVLPHLSHLFFSFSFHLFVHCIWNTPPNNVQWGFLYTYKYQAELYSDSRNALLVRVNLLGSSVVLRKLFLSATQQHKDR